VKIRDIMSTDLACAEPRTSVREVADMMRREDCGSIPVARDGRLMGIITDRDITVRVVAEGLDPGSVHVEEVMTPDVATVSPDEDTAEALERMRLEQVRRLPVVEGDRLVGLVAMGKLAQKAGSANEVGAAEQSITRGA
jgi:CBS domain-containing protein